ncbi:helix-turn-helix transcriptional regulator [Halorussus caseinilyticus]|uniref:Helix-turn-helix transcriptional regulator n=1 Tax=Halorussus caseinilyticus TaxID=3034025 RepID=A0ABD5WRI5_9EURY|nr:hypothetical protein [Halorussus sp. DT72]
MRLSVALLVVLLAVSPLVGAGAGHPADGRAHATDTARAVSGVPTATDAANVTAANATVSDGTEMYVSLHEDGSARWTVTTQFALRDANETEAFRQLATDYESGGADTGLRKATFERVVKSASEDADRPMELRGVNRSARTFDNATVGSLSLSFTWTNFTRVEESRIILGDVFSTQTGTWLPTLADDQTLVIEAPPGYVVWNSPQGVVNGTMLRYEGPRTLDADDLSATYKPRVQAPSTTNETSTGFPNVSGTWGLVVVFLLFGGFGAYALAQRRGADPEAVGESDDRRPESSPGVSATADPENEAPPETDEDGGDEPDTELLSDEERVLRLLRDNEGRMKQGQIVKETNWSNAKVSQLLSKMDDNDDVDKLRIGRENLITLPDEDVTDVE